MSAKIIIVLLIFFHYVSFGSCYDQYIKVYKLNTDSSRKEIGNTFVYNISSENYQILSVRNTLTGNPPKNKESFQVDKKSGILSMSSNLNSIFELTIQMKNIKKGVLKTVSVRVDIIEISDRMIQNSGSIQFYGITAKDFFVRNKGENLYDKLKRTIKARIDLYHINRYHYIDSNINVEIFAINKNPINASLLDVRYKVTSKITKNVVNVVHYMLMQDKNNIEKELGIQITY